MNAQIDYLSLPLQTFLTDLAGRTPTPGGGAAAAMIGAVSAAQARMVVEYTVGKARFAEHESKLRDVLQEFVRAETAFGELISEDMAAYERLAASRKSSDEQEQQRAVATAIAVPMETLMLAAAISARFDEIKGCVNPFLYSDLKVSATLAFACARCAAFNVEVNLPALTDRPKADELKNQVDSLVKRAHDHRGRVVHHQPA